MQKLCKNQTHFSLNIHSLDKNSLNLHFFKNIHLNKMALYVGHLWLTCTITPLSARSVALCIQPWRVCRDSVRYQAWVSTQLLSFYYDGLMATVAALFIKNTHEVQRYASWWVFVRQMMFSKKVFSHRWQGVKTLIHLRISHTQTHTHHRSVTSVALCNLRMIPLFALSVIILYFKGLLCWWFEWCAAVWRIADVDLPVTGIWYALLARKLLETDANCRVSHSEAEPAHTLPATQSQTPAIWREILTYIQTHTHRHSHIFRIQCQD